MGTPEMTAAAKPPKVSIGMPLYNSAQYMGEALDCLLAQTFADFELILSDDASSDETPALAEAAAAGDSRIRLTLLETNTSQRENFGAVLDAARGEYFLWRAFDDWSDADYIERLAACLDANPRADLAVGVSAHADLDRRQTARAPAPTGLGNLERRTRVAGLMGQAQAGWFYGLYRTAALRPVFARTRERYAYTWGWDHLIVLPFILNDALAATGDTVMVQRETGLSDSRFRPKRAAEQRRMARSFLVNTGRIWRTSRLSLHDKAALLPLLPVYASGKTEKYLRILKNSVLQPFAGSPVD